jgi:hypothetical protein
MMAEDERAAALSGSLEPGEVLASHPALCALSVAGAASAGATMAARAVRARGHARLAWGALAALEFGIVAGIVFSVVEARRRST